MKLVFVLFYAQYEVFDNLDIFDESSLKIIQLLKFCDFSLNLHKKLITLYVKNFHSKFLLKNDKFICNNFILMALS